MKASVNPKIEEITIDGEIYVPKVSVKSNTIAHDGLKPVLIRADRAGVHFGFLKSEAFTPSGKVVTLVKTRRVYYWDGAATLSQMALEGVSKPGNCKFTVEISENEIVGVIETLPLTDIAYTNLNSVGVWRQ